MKPCNRCRQLKRPDEMSAGKSHCKQCRNADQNDKRRERVARVAAKGFATPRTHVGTGTFTTDNTYRRNDGLKHIPSRGEIGRAHV